MSLLRNALGLLLLVLLVGSVVVYSPSAAATGRDERAARRVEREMAREASRAERAAERAARRAERETDKVSEDGACSCRASLGLAKPVLRWRDGELHFIPRVDVSIRSRGDHSDPAWTAKLKHEGVARYESDDVAVPVETQFSGERDIVSGSCGSDWSFRGYQLPAVPLAGITSQLVGLDQRLDGDVRLKTELSGCGFDAEFRHFGWRLEDMVNMRLGSWRRVR